MKKLVRLNERELNRLIQESVRKVINNIGKPSSPRRRRKMSESRSVRRRRRLSESDDYIEELADKIYDHFPDLRDYDPDPDDEPEGKVYDVNNIDDYYEWMENNYPNVEPMDYDVYCDVVDAIEEDFGVDSEVASKALKRVIPNIHRLIFGC